MKEGDASMPGRPKHPQLFIERVREPIDAAGWSTNRVYVSLLDSGSPTFAATQRGPSGRDRAARSLLAARTTSMHRDAVR